MSRFFVERRTISNKRRFAVDLVHHLQRRCLVGVAVVVVGRPTYQLAVIRKEWIRAEYQVQRQAASTLGERRETLLTENDRLREVQFISAGTKKSIDDASVVLAAPTTAQSSLPTTYTTLYIATPLDSEQKTVFANNLEPGGLIVDYDIEA